MQIIQIKISNTCTKYIKENERKKTHLQMGKGDQLYDNKLKLNFWW